MSAGFGLIALIFSVTVLIWIMPDEAAGLWLPSA
jgi:hypothetical protein